MTARLDGSAPPGASKGMDYRDVDKALAAYVRINDPKIRRDILGLIKAAAAD